MEQQQRELILSTGEYNGVLEKSIQIEGAIISKTSYVKKHAPQWHCHENMHIAFVWQKAKSNTLKQECFTKKGGSIFFYHSEEMHKYTTFEPISNSANIEIPLSFLEKYGLSESQIKENITQKVDAKSLIVAMQKELLMNDQGTNTHLLSLLLSLISKSAKANRLKPNWVIQLETLLHDLWDQPLSLQTLSNIIGVHPVTISKNFKGYFACTLGEYRRKIKIEKSIALIKSTEMSLSEIAHFCQFTDQSHFIRNFKKYTGFLPKDFRRF